MQIIINVDALGDTPCSDDGFVGDNDNDNDNADDEGDNTGKM